MSDKQSGGREANGATLADKPDASTSSKEVEKTGRRESEIAGPDGPDAGAVGETFKRTGG